MTTKKNCICMFSKDCGHKLAQVEFKQNSRKKIKYQYNRLGLHDILMAYTIHILHQHNCFVPTLYCRFSQKMVLH